MAVHADATCTASRPQPQARVHAAGNNLAVGGHCHAGNPPVRTHICAGLRDRERLCLAFVRVRRICKVVPKPAHGPWTNLGPATQPGTSNPQATCSQLTRCAPMSWYIACACACPWRRPSRTGRGRTSPARMDVITNSIGKAFIMTRDINLQCSLSATN